MKGSTRNKILNRSLKFVKKPSWLLGFGILAMIFWEYYGKDMGLKELLEADINVVDGDTIAVKGEKIRLQGIDAPEEKQECGYMRGGKKIKYLCGQEATRYLKKLIAGKEIECTNEGNDMYGRRLAYCYVEGTNINRKMVLDGWAVGYNKEFAVEELVAMTAGRGLWRGEFERPKDWRKTKQGK